MLQQYLAIKQIQCLLGIHMLYTYSAGPRGPVWRRQTANGLSRGRDGLNPRATGGRFAT